MTTPHSAKTSTRPIDAPQALVGRILEGRYRLDEVLTVGGMGIIFQATQMNIGRRVAVKMLKPTLSNDYDLIRRFDHETEVLARLSHPNIVSLIDSGRDASGLTYLVMEYLAGSTLREMLRQCELTLPEILEAFAQTCDGLLEAHAHSVIHRDLKFDNIMVRRFRDGRLHITILDFGVAKRLTYNQALTRTGEVPGTPGIIAPELIENGQPSPRSDLYSLGVLLFTALTGQAPFSGRNELELMRAHRFEEVPNLRAIVGERIPEEILELVYELMQKDPKLRPRDAGAVRDRLETIAANFRKRHPDVSHYVPPRGDVVRRLTPDPQAHRSSERAERFITGRLDELPKPEEPERIIAPTSVVAVLITVLIVLVLILIYLLYQTFVLPKP